MTGLADVTSARSRRRRLAGLVFAVTLTVLLRSDAAMLAQAHTLTGAWATTITPRNCQTNVPVAPPFRALVTFHRDGTVTESVASPGFAPGQRTTGHGHWTPGGAKAYDERSVAMLLFDGGAGNFLAGSQVTTRTMTLTDENHYTSTGFAEFFDLAGQSYRIGCATGAGVRIPER